MAPTSPYLAMPISVLRAFGIAPASRVDCDITELLQLFLMRARVDSAGTWVGTAARS